MEFNNNGQDHKTSREYLSEVKKDTDRILNILLGDQEAEQDGLVHKVKKHSQYIEKDKKFKWSVASLLFGGTGSMVAFKENIAEFFKGMFQ